MSSLAALATAEGVTVAPATRLPSRRRPLIRWVAVAVAVWALAGTGIGQRQVLNAGGLETIADFTRAAFTPDVSSEFLRRTVSAAAVTVGYATLGTLLSITIGLIGGVLLARTTWTSRLTTERTPVGVSIARAIATAPRAIHEGIWALLLINVLGRNPMVGVLAIGIPYGAITAKVYADLIDAPGGAAHRSLRAGGAGRVSSLFYAVLPRVGADMTSYAFYRFECAVRAAVILGMLGAGGLGFQLSQSFQGLAYREMWTSIYALIALGALAEGWSTIARSGRRARSTALIGSALVAVSWWKVAPDLSTIWGPRTRREASRLAHELWPPRLPTRGWSQLIDAAVATVRMSVVAIAIAAAIAVPLAYFGVRSIRGNKATRVVALVLRSIPSPVWAFLVLLVVLPGLLPGAVALGIYTGGVLARLLTETLDNADTAPARRLRQAGARPLAAFVHSTLPDVSPTWTAYGLYRWEVTAREVSIVGVVGAGGLGALLQQQTAAFAYQRLLTTLLAMMAVTLLVDAVSSSVRRRLR